MRANDHTTRSRGYGRECVPQARRPGSNGGSFKKTTTGKRRSEVQGEGRKIHFGLGMLIWKSR